jgi:aspartyl-tRNA(Asn)/glutamyl-tRNA(Gln) amidotransferase subunit C
MMMMTKEELAQIALVARIGLAKDEAEYYMNGLQPIFKQLKRLSLLNLDDVEPTAHVLPIENAFRADQADSSLGVEEALGNAPEIQDGFFKVPKIV